MKIRLKIILNILKIDFLQEFHDFHRYVSSSHLSLETFLEDSKTTAQGHLRSSRKKGERDEAIVGETVGWLW